jgi:hypothetical protein
MRCHSAQPRKAGFLGCHPYAGAPDNHRDEDAGKGKRTNWSIHSQHVRPTPCRSAASGRLRPIVSCNGLFDGAAAAARTNAIFQSSVSHNVTCQPSATDK